ncbi:hypothetical protein GCM10023084_36700 [Streptomyces lacrimifluminis]|uniref:Uncharacterized protein n=1 Tax=Streptomyces lacrimifluminis TaxID=1500077 RepID=A0A917L0P5_9ACTN|nr:hypothetical protein [Streptomyces lacrimifluminis]GGJ37023.1 hypothetical protein GCM10012282_37250 [Streptomyces lacrimifluminis]
MLRPGRGTVDTICLSRGGLDEKITVVPEDLVFRSRATAVQAVRTEYSTARLLDVPVEEGGITEVVSSTRQRGHSSQASERCGAGGGAEVCEPRLRHRSWNRW